MNKIQIKCGATLKMPKEKNKIQLTDFELKEDSQSLYKGVKGSKVRGLKGGVEWQS